MRTETRIALIAWLALSNAGAIAQVGTFGQMLMTADPGEWREYRITGGQFDGTVLRWTFLNTEERESATYQWLEMNMTADGLRVITKTLVSRDDPAKPPIAAIIKHGEQPAFQMPPKRLAETLSTKPTPPAPREIGPATVDVMAGRFETTQFESEFEGVVTKLYLSDSLGLVLTEGTDPSGHEYRMELTAAGGGGESAIREKPIVPPM